MKISEAVINFAVYENGTEYFGQAEITLPEIAHITEEIKGAGISGSYESSIVGHLQPMSVSLNFKTVTKDTVTLLEPRNHQLELRAAQQERNSVTGNIDVIPIKYVMIALPKKLALGKIGVATPADASGEFSVTYLATFIDGQKQLEIDIINNVFFVGGKDYLQNTRKALGK